VGEGKGLPPDGAKRNRVSFTPVGLNHDVYSRVMARPTDWRRAQAPAAAPHTDQSTTLCTLAPGETITRIRLFFELTWSSANLYAFSGVPIIWGIFLQTQPSGPTLDPFTDASDEGWLWWEGVGLRNQPAQSSGTLKYVDQGPTDPGYRDIKAMRKADPTTGSFVVWRCKVSPLVPTQAIFAQVVSSCLVILP